MMEITARCHAKPILGAALGKTVLASQCDIDDFASNGLIESRIVAAQDKLIQQKVQQHLTVLAGVWVELQQRVEVAGKFQIKRPDHCPIIVFNRTLEFG